MIWITVELLQFAIQDFMLMIKLRGASVPRVQWTMC